MAGGEALAGLLRAGNAGSNTAADHVKVLDMALESLPEHARPGDPSSPRALARSDSAAATHLFAAACRKRGMGSSFGFPVDERIQKIVDLIPDQCWHPAIEDEGLREGAWVAEATGMIDLSAWPEGSRLILRKERPHPGAQLTFTDVDGHRITAFLTDTPRGVIPHQIAGLELRHCQHARVEDRIREGKAAGLRSLPCRGGRKLCLAGGGAGRRRPRLLGQADLLHRRAIAAAAQLTRASTEPGGGPPRSPKASAGCAPPSPDQPPPRLLNHHRLASACPLAAIPPAQNALRSHTPARTGQLSHSEASPATSQDRQPGLETLFAERGRLGAVPSLGSATALT